MRLMRGRWFTVPLRNRTMHSFRWLNRFRFTSYLADRESRLHRNSGAGALLLFQTLRVHILLRQGRNGYVTVHSVASACTSSLTVVSVARLANLPKVAAWLSIRVLAS